MAKRFRLLDVLEAKIRIQMVLMFAVLALVGLEMLIFIAATSYSGERSRLEVKDRHGQVVYYASGSKLEDVNRTYFERNFGSLDNYRVEVKTDSVPFPVRAWVSASVGVPVVLTLLVAFLVKVYLALLYGGESSEASTYPAVYRKPHPFVSLSMILGSSSIFYIGVFVGLSMLAFWMVPNLIGDIVGFGVGVIRESSWAVLAMAGFVGLFAMWVAFLRYRLSRRMMDHQFSLEKYRLDREYERPKQISTNVPESVGESLRS